VPLSIIDLCQGLLKFGPWNQFIQGDGNSFKLVKKREYLNLVG
jgi:hypothetical protein